MSNLENIEENNLNTSEINVIILNKLIKLDRKY